MLKTLWSLAFVSLILSSCGDKQESTKDVPYYLEHSDERKAKLTQCKNNPRELENTPNCRNASEAEGQHLLNSF